MNYHCYTPFEGERCPVCGSTRVREITPDDECLVMEGDGIATSMLCEVLKDQQIPCYQQSQIGAAMAVLTGRQTERFNVLVPYHCLEEAKAVADALFAPVDEDADPFPDVDIEEEEMEEEDDEE